MAGPSGMRIINIAEVLNALTTARDSVVASARRAMIKGSEIIEDQIIKNSPIDTGELETSIEMKLDKAIGPGIYRFNIGVSDKASKYAWIVHEYPWHKRGPKTKAKGPQAGPRYVARAFEKHYKTVRLLVEDAIIKTIERQNRRASRR